MFTEIIVLVVLLVMIIMAIVLSKRNTNYEDDIETEINEPVVIAEENNDEELIAILTAAIMAYSKNNVSLVVKSFRKVGDNAPTWNRVSRIR